MAKRTRVTTSVSTLVNDVAYLNDVARMARRTDIINGLSDLNKRINDLVHEYNSIRSELYDFKLMIQNGAPVQNEETEEVEAEVEVEV